MKSFQDIDTSAVKSLHRHPVMPMFHWPIQEGLKHSMCNVQGNTVHNTINAFPMLLGVNESC